MHVGLFREIEVEIEVAADATAAVEFLTDLPGDQLEVRSTRTFSAAARRVYTYRLPGTTIGRLYQLRVTAQDGAVRLYRARVLARMSGTPQSDWTWIDLPVIPTPEDWLTIPLPIPPTPEDWATIQLPIEPTPEDWVTVKLPLPEEIPGWRWEQFPIQGGS